MSIVNENNPTSDGEQLFRGASQDEWGALFESAALFERLEPWNWIQPLDFFGVQLADEEIAFVSIMGAGLPHHACFAFYGWQAFRTVGELIRQRRLTIRDLIETKALQLTYVEAGELGPLDLAIATFGGAKIATEPSDQPVAVFREHRPGYMPWLLEGAQVGRFSQILRQTIGVAMRLESDPELLRSGRANTIFVRQCDSAGTWHDQWLEPPAKHMANKPPVPDQDQIEKVAKLPCRPQKVQFDLALSQATVGDPGSRLRTTYLLAAFDSERGDCLGADVILPTDGIDEMWRSVPDRFLALCLHAGTRPREVEVRTDKMMGTLRPLLGELPIKLTFRSELSHYESFLEGMNRVSTTEESESDE